MNQESLAPLTRPSNLRETVLERLRTAIITGELIEGELHSAPTLGTALGVSATPVREAMMELAREGLVETVKNKGFRIKGMTDEELDNLAEIRLLIEPPTVAKVAGKVSQESLEKLRELADTCTAAAESEDLVEYLRIDREFHALVLQYAGNEQLVELATSLRRRTRLYGLTALAREGKLTDSSREHHTLIEHLENGETQQAEALMHRHIGHARDIWAKSGSEQASS